MTQQWSAKRDFPTSTFKLKAAFSVRANSSVRTPEASPGRPVLPMLDSKWSMLGAGCTSSVSTGVCVDQARERFYSAFPDSRQKNRGVDGLNGVISHQSLQIFIWSHKDQSRFVPPRSQTLASFVGVTEQQNCLELLLLLTGDVHLSLRVKHLQNSWFRVKIKEITLFAAVKWKLDKNVKLLKIKKTPQISKLDQCGSHMELWRLLVDSY